jgi:predicted TIM-barrel fold metal-dependent hydrolase
MVITDSQVHVWGADTPDRPWPPGRAHQAQKPYPVTKDMLRNAMDEAGVARVVIVPPSWEGDRNDLALEAARLPCSYRQAVTMFTEELAWLKGSDLEGVMGRGLSAWLGWPEGK